ncbi:MAG: hybrid sensor histidine kinase/response regulator [Burkholderia sp.]|nr:hybrid sensor histidine kinase/response regulator [Burkholderia sp.]
MPISFFKLNSLRSRLMLVVALAIAPSVLLTVYNGWRERQQAITSAEENLQRLTSLAAANEAQSIKSARQILSDLSDVPDLLGDTDKCEALLRAVLNKNPDYANFGLIQLNGDVTCSAVPSPTPVNLSDRAHFKMAVSERRFIAGNYVFGRVIQKHTINLTYPVIDEDGEVVAVVFSALDLAALDKFVSDINLPSGSILVTADGAGTIISRRPDPEKWFGFGISSDLRQAMSREQRSPLLLDGPDGIERLHTFARVGTPDISDFTVTIGIPKEAIVAPALRDQVMALLALAATMILALLATWFVGDYMIVRRMKALVATADKIAAGNFAARSGIGYGSEEISYLARALDDMAQSLQRKQAERDKAEQDLRAADQRKDEFLAMLAHELRNPLAPISAAAQLLKLVQLDEARVKQTSDIIARQVDHMTSLVDDLLDVSRVTRGLVTLDLKPLDLNPLVSDAVEQVSPLIKTRRHQLTVELPEDSALVAGDQKRLVQVIANLLNNSAKYTPEGGNIVLSVEVLKDHVALSVNDDGIGMEPELVSRVFELFAQAERTSDRSQGGLGLGLALVRSLVGLHGGSVQAYSKGTGKGSTFSIRLPRLCERRAEPRVQAEIPLVATPAGMMRMIVVDDNADAAHTLAMFLEAEGHEVAVEYEATGALARARAIAPRVCLLDIGLPDIDGNELARRLRAMPETAKAVLIAVTGYGREQDKKDAMAAGFDYHFVKPVDTSKLAALLAQISVR